MNYQQALVLFRLDMQEAVQKQTERIAKYGTKWLYSKHSDWILAAIAFSESVFAPIIIDPFLIALIIAKRQHWKRYIVISVSASVVGGLAGYALGALFYDTIGTHIVGIFGLENLFMNTARNVDANGFVFVLIGAFTPIPYKLVAIASGLLHINLFTFLVASIFGRVLRLGLVGFVTYTIGPKALPIMQRNLHILVAVVGIMLITYIIVKVF